jgi:hypothetical protein
MTCLPPLSSPAMARATANPMDVGEPALASSPGRLLAVAAVDEPGGAEIGLLRLLAALSARGWGVALLAVFGAATVGSAIAELDATGYQLPPATIHLSGWAASLPKEASIRLDLWPPEHLWAAYFLAARPLCSQLPLLNTEYAHVPVSRQADYIVATIDSGRPADAIGKPLRQNAGYRLYRENPSIAGPSACSQRRLDRIYTGRGFSPQ